MGMKAISLNVHTEQLATIHVFLEMMLVSYVMVTYIACIQNLHIVNSD